MLLIAVGYGKKINQDILKDIAGSNGHVLRFSDVAELIKNIDAIVADACGKNEIESYYRPVLYSYQFVTSTCSPPGGGATHRAFEFFDCPPVPKRCSKDSLDGQMPHPRAIFLGV